MGFATGSLVQIDDRYRDIGPAQQPASFKPPLTGYQAAIGGDYHRVQQADLGNTVNQWPEVPKVLAVTEADLDLLNSHRDLLWCLLRAVSSFNLSPAEPGSWLIGITLGTEQTQSRDGKQPLTDSLGDAAAFPHQRPA